MSPPAPEPPPSVEVGFTRVDDQPDASFLVAGMEATARWPAVQQLRRWERERLALGPGDRLLDVGCGIGDAAIALAGAVAPGGEVLAIDASQAMLDAARRRAAAGDAPAVRFRFGDAHELEEPDASFTAVRSERVLQWLPDPEVAIGEMVRVLQPGGRLSLIDTDWRTLASDLPAAAGGAVITDALLRMRGDGAFAGGRLLNLCRDVGLTDLSCTGAVHIWTEWAPEGSPGPDGMFPLRLVIPQLIGLGLVDEEVGTRFLDAMVDAGRTDRFCTSLSMIAVSARKA